MQTFLPYANFEKSFQVLDMKRLGKQRVEAMQILNVLSGKQTTKGWNNHPALLMWEGYENALELYHDYSILEWKKRGYKNTMEYKVFKSDTPEYEHIPEMPWWFGLKKIHRSHRSRLIAKDPQFYLPIFPDDEGYNDGKYWWPDNKTKTLKLI